MLILPMPGNDVLALGLTTQLGAELGEIETRRFPDGESYVRLRSDVARRDVAVVCTLARPDDQFLMLEFTARLLRASGAARLTLVAPYLAYMRQDKAFHEGEAVTSAYFARLISAQFDRLVTIDPHLHRHASLAEIYTIPTEDLHAAPLIAEWIGANVKDALIIGPDAESRQWAAEIAEDAGAPFVVLNKQRRGDRDVEVSLPDLTPWRGRHPVLIDDIVSSGGTMIGAARGLLAQDFGKPTCLVVHPLFAGDAFERLSSLAAQVVSTDTVPHPSNGIAIVPLLARCLAG